MMRACRGWSNTPAGLSISYRSPGSPGHAAASADVCRRHVQRIKSTLSYPLRGLWHPHAGTSGRYCQGCGCARLSGSRWLIRVTAQSGRLTARPSPACRMCWPWSVNLLVGARARTARRRDLELDRQLCSYRKLRSWVGRKEVPDNLWHKCPCAGR